MNLIIDIHDKIVKIILLRDGKEINKLEFPEINNLSEKLLLSISKILDKNNLKPKDIVNMELKSNLTESFTTYRIGKVVMDTFNWSNKI